MPEHATGPAEPQPDRAALRVLVVGRSSDLDPCDVYRTGMYVGALAANGVRVTYALPSAVADGPLDPVEYERQVDRGVERLQDDASKADVVVFRRAYATHSLCLQCGLATLDTGVAAGHVRSTGHAVDVGADLAVRRFFERLDAPAARTGPAIVYETDDDLLRMDATNGQQRIIGREQDLVTRMVGRADLVTTSTPILARRLARIAAEVRVVRNAVDPRWYVDGPGLDGGAAQGEPPIAFYGSIGRLRDYRVCAPAVDAIARRHRALRRVWIGAPALQAEVDRVSHLFDEIHPYVAGVPAFARQLAALRPGIGLAPLVGSAFDRGKSELHWLEYAMAGGATVATKIAGGGPYDVIRHGIDGFLVGNRTEWRAALERLAGSPGLRTDMAARARERVLAEYTVDVRATEWADAYGVAADHVGRGIDVGRARSQRIRQSPRPPRRRRAGQPIPPTQSSPQPSRSPARSPAEILAAYVAAQAFAGKTPLRLRLGLNGSSAAPSDVTMSPPDGWVTIDTVGTPDLCHHVGYGLPFGDGTVDTVEADDIIEALGPLGAILAMEAGRVLRPGGAFRVRTSDRVTVATSQAALAVQGVTMVGSDGRLPVYTADSLDRLLREAGFVHIRRILAAAGELTVEALR